MAEKLNTKGLTVKKNDDMPEWLRDAAGIGNLPGGPGWYQEYFQRGVGLGQTERPDQKDPFPFPTKGFKCGENAQTIEPRRLSHH